MGEHVVNAKPAMKVVRTMMSAFDEHRPPSVELIEDCVHCGFCLPTCPTYALWGEEMDSPRGRIYLMKLGLEGDAGMTVTYVGHFDKCLGCMACLTACPSGVQYDKLIEATRAQIERRYTRSFTDKLFRRMLFELFPYPSRLRLMAAPLWLYQRTGMQRLLRHTGLMKLLPERLQAMESVLPPVSLSALHSELPMILAAVGPARRRVGLLTGCVQRVFFSEVNQATARVLAAEGCEVVVPREQACCGALMVHAGQEELALAFARRLIDTFEQAEVDSVVINAAGCGSTMKEYGHLLRDDPAYAERAKAFAAKCRDVSEILVELGPRAPRHPVRLRVAYHDACHLQHAQGVRAEPREVLKTIPGLVVLEVPEAAICCGSAGIYNIVEPEAARELGERKVRNVLETDPQAVISSNPGCLLQIASGLERAGHPLPTLHMVEILDASIREIEPEALLQRR
ncbi:MAG: glycolate oxidase subunit GlcF [Acidobacteriota bacterium]|nr:glycolate oxidase subunit GlcF [Acidobacteriota bacterium]